MGVRFEGKSDDYLRKLTNAIGDEGGGLDAATQYLSSKISASMPGAGAAVFPGTGGDTGTRARYIPSNPGQPPGVRTNRLRGSYTNAKLGALRWAAGTNVAYARHLEFGTATMPARPHIRQGLRNNTQGLSRVFVAATKRKMGGGA